MLQFPLSWFFGSDLLAYLFRIIYIILWRHLYTAPSILIFFVLVIPIYNSRFDNLPLMALCSLNGKEVSLEVECSTILPPLRINWTLQNSLSLSHIIKYPKILTRVSWKQHSPMSTFCNISYASLAAHSSCHHSFQNLLTSSKIPISLIIHIFSLSMHSLPSLPFSPPPWL